MLAIENGENEGLLATHDSGNACLARVGAQGFQPNGASIMPKQMAWWMFWQLLFVSFVFFSSSDSGRRGDGVFHEVGGHAGEDHSHSRLLLLQPSAETHHTLPRYISIH